MRFNMQIKILLRITQILIVISFLSCDNNDPIKPETEISEGMIPFKVGNQWTWNVFKNSEDGRSLIHQYTVEVIKDTMINGEKWYIEREDNLFNTIPLTNRDGVTYSYYNGEPKIVFNTSIEDTSLPSVNSNKSYLVSKNNIVEIPLGKFNCNLYQIYDESNGNKTLRLNYYIAYNKGIIKIDNFGCIDSLCNTATYELASTNVF